MTANAIYVNPTGWEVREFSHSQYNTYKQCPKKFYWERIVGWKQKQGAGMEFGKAIETGVKAIYQKLDPVEQFELQWAQAKENKKIVYKDGESWEWFHTAGVGLMTRFKNDWQKFPPRNPVFPDYKNALKIKDERTGKIYQTIPDLIDSSPRDGRGEVIADIKAMGNLLNDEVPGLVVMDLQLRTQAAVHYRFSPNKTWRVALWNFCTKPKRVDAASAGEIVEAAMQVVVPSAEQLGEAVALYIAHEANGLTYEKAGEFLRIANPKEAMKPLTAAKKSDKELAEILERVASAVAEAHKPQYIIQWVEGTMTEEHANEGLREELSVVPLIQQNYFPHVGGMRFPNNKCVWCSHRGLCMEELCGPREEYTQITSAELYRFDADSIDENI